MKQFSCNSLVPGCPAEFTGTTNGEILAQVAVHARADHGVVEVAPELVAQVQKKIVFVP